MALPPLSWGRYIAIVLLYWVLVVGSWMFYTTRPSTQRRAREQAVIAGRKEPLGGGAVVTISSTIHLRPIGALRLGPPVAPFVVWLALRGQCAVLGWWLTTA